MIAYDISKILDPQPEIHDQKRAYLFPHISGSQPVIARRYDSDFRPNEAYKSSLPDMTETVDSVEGANVAIQQVGVSGFRLPLTLATGTVSLEANLKGINMSRIIRTFYAHREENFTLDTLSEILRAYRREVGGYEARLKVAFSYPMLVPSLRSGLEGYQYYNGSYMAQIDAEGRIRRQIELDFVYSSACPCSAELAEHARDFRSAYAIPHSQRSKTRITVEVAAGASLHLEDLVLHAREALKTETQVLVKREDEQAFAELNGAYVKFVEDAARLIYQELQHDPRISDFQAACAHLESLHSHDAVSVICKGVPGGFRADFHEFSLLVC